MEKESISPLAVRLGKLLLSILERKLCGQCTVRDNKEGFKKYVNSKGRTSDNAGSLFDGDGHFINSDKDGREIYEILIQIVKWQCSKKMTKERG